MALKSFDRVKVSTTTAGGTDAYVLGASSSGFRTFASVMADGEKCVYCCTDNVDWEVGIGTWNTGNTLSRTTILASSNAGAAVVWGGGSRSVFITDTAAYASRMPRWAKFTESDVATIGSSGTTAPTIGTDSLAAMGHAAAASGTGAIALGNQNTATNSFNADPSVSVGGYNNTANTGGSCFGGFGNTASTGGACIGGSGNTATGAAGAGVFAGNGNELIGVRGATVLGGTNCFNAVPGARHTGAGVFDSGLSEATAFTLPVGAESTDASGDDLVYTDDGAKVITSFNNAVYGIEAIIVARAAGGDVKAWRLAGVLKTDGSGVVSVVGTTTVEVLGADAGAAAWTVDLLAGATPARVRVVGYGEAATTITWGGNVRAIMLSYIAP